MALKAVLGISGPLKGTCGRIIFIGAVIWVFLELLLDPYLPLRSEVLTIVPQERSSAKLCFITSLS